MIRRKLILEIRGFPYNGWTEGSSKTTVKDIRSWGWWVNRADIVRMLERPKVCIYADCLERISI